MERQHVSSPTTVRGSRRLDQSPCEFCSDDKDDLQCDNRLVGRKRPRKRACDLLQRAHLLYDWFAHSVPDLSNASSKTTSTETVSAARGPIIGRSKTNMSAPSA